MRIELFGENDLRTIISLNNKGWVLMELDKFEEAKSIYQKALMSLEKTAGDEHEYKSILMNNISLIFMELKETEC